MYKQKFALNVEGRDFFVGDLHGAYDKFNDALKAVNFDESVDRIFSVGDLIDRGSKSLACLKLIDRPWFHAILGNHEEFMLAYPNMFDVWMGNGGHWATPLIDTGEIWKWQERLTQLPLVIEVEAKWGKVGVVHAESAPSWLHNSEAFRNDNLWARKKHYAKDETRIKDIDVVVVGHTPQQDVKVLGNVVYIDTGACWSDGKVTLMPIDWLEYLKN